MKNKYLVLAIAGIIAYSCTSGGNKSIIPVEESEQVTATPVTTEEEHHQTDDMKHEFTFTAFKTPTKKPVTGTFKEILLLTKTTTETAKVSEHLNGASFEVNTNSIDTNNNPARDEKLVNFFFSKLSSPKITGSFGKFENGKVPVKISMNGIEKEIPMNYSETEKNLTLNGTIDIVKDFSGTDALSSINQACFDLHEGKTWSDVNIQAKFTK